MKSIKYFCFGLILVTSFYLASCNDNPVNNTEQPFSFDSARFNVKYKKTLTFFALDEAYIIDTDKIFLADIYGFAYYKNGEFIYKPFNFNFSSLYVNGFNENNVFLCGSEYVGNNRSRQKLIKWNGVDFEHIQMEDTISGNRHEFTHVYCKSPNEIWLGGGDGTAWKYDGTKFTKYLLDTNFIGQGPRMTYLLTDGNDNLCCVQIRDSGSAFSYSVRYFDFYKFNNIDKFELLTEKRFDDYDTPAFPKRVGNKMYTVSRKGLFEFDGYNFNKIIDIGPIEDPLGYVAGTGPDDLMIAGRISSHNTLNTPCTYHWNGKKWSKEDKFLSYTNFASYLTYVNNMYVSVECAPEWATFVKFLRKN